MMDCLYAHCTPCITDCVMAELEKLGTKYRVSLKVAKDPRVERLPCTHAGTYADDCLCERVTQHKCYIVATCDKDLRRRLRKSAHTPAARCCVCCERLTPCVLASVPGVPIMFITRHQYNIERLPEATLVRRGLRRSLFLCSDSRLSRRAVHPSNKALLSSSEYSSERPAC